MNFLLLILYLFHLISFWVTVVYSSFYSVQQPSKSFREIRNVVFFNQIIITPIFISLFVPYINFEIVNPYGSNLILWLVIGLTKFWIQIFILNLMFGTLHYFCHKNKTLFKQIHYLHHELIIPHGAGAIYCHPIEQIIVNLIPVIIPIILLQSDFIWTCIFISFVSYETVIGHTVFQEPTITSRHNLHHKLFIVNFDNYPYILDKLIGTYRNS